MGNALKDPSTEVKDSIVTLQLNVNELAAIMKVIMMAWGRVYKRVVLPSARVKRKS